MNAVDGLRMDGDRPPDQLNALIGGLRLWAVAAPALRRSSLKSAADDGLSLAPGERVSIAFATWDGAARDRNGQKLVTIWHDLVLE